jgi:hypothetical protein
MDGHGLMPCLRKLLLPDKRLKRCKKDRLHAYRSMLALDCRRAGYSEQETAVALRQLYGQAWPGVAEPVLVRETDRYAGWIFRQDPVSPMCQGIRQQAQHLCDEVRANGGCAFAEQRRKEANQLREEQRKLDLFEALRWPNTLQELHGGTGQVAAICYISLRSKMVSLDLTYVDTILISMREFQRECEKAGLKASLDTICKAVHLLTTEDGHGLIKCVVKGKKGRPGKGEKGEASGYQTILPTPQPPGEEK